MSEQRTQEQAERDHELLLAINAGCGAIQMLASIVEGCRRSGGQLAHSATTEDMRARGYQMADENADALRRAARHVHAAYSTLGKYCNNVDISGGMEDRHLNVLDAAFQSMHYAIGDDDTKGDS